MSNTAERIYKSVHRKRGQHYTTTRSNMCCRAGWRLSMIVWEPVKTDALIRVPITQPEYKAEPLSGGTSTKLFLIEGEREPFIDSSKTAGQPECGRRDNPRVTKSIYIKVLVPRTQCAPWDCIRALGEGEEKESHQLLWIWRCSLDREFTEKTWS